MFDLSVLATPEGWISLLTLMLLEIVLGIDNIVFISILSSKLSNEKDQRNARVIGLALALIVRVALLFAIGWLVQMSEPLFIIFKKAVSVRDLILIAGGLFLIAKSTTEIHSKLEGGPEQGVSAKKFSLSGVIFQIVLLDIVFSVDSILTAVGLTKEIAIMVIAVIVSIIVMLIFAKAVSKFIDEHPTIKMLALSFLLMIGLLLVVEGFHIDVPKGYVYFAMAFSLFVELLNLKLWKRNKPVKLKQPYSEDNKKPAQLP